MASLIVDRAKRESFVWLTRRLHEDVCGGANAVYGEARSFWLPTTCSLAGGSIQFMQYGDADIMRTLRGAIATDVSTWHGAALGLGFGATLWADMDVDTNLLACDAQGDEPPLCAAAGADKVACEMRRKNL